VWISQPPTRTFLLACLALAFAPLLIFTNLHIAHSYYQASNQIFLLMTVAGGAGTLLDLPKHQPRTHGLVLASLTIIIIANLHHFAIEDWPRSQRLSSDKLAVGRLINKNTPNNSAILVIGDDWSSAFAYHSQRRAFTQPNWPVLRRSAADVLRDPQTALGGSPLGAVVSKQPIDTTQLPPACQPSQQRTIKRWHVVICGADQ